MLCIRETLLAAQANLDVTLLCSFWYDPFANDIFRNFGALVLMKRMKLTHLLERQHGAYMLLIPH